MKKGVAGIKEVAMKKVMIPRIAVWGLVVVLLVSCCANMIQLAQWSSGQVLQIPGSYSTNGGLGTYLVFDQEGNYCKYNQTDGLLEEGVYVTSGDHQYRLEGNQGERGDILLVKDGIYYTDQDDSLTYAAKFSDIPTFVGNWSLDWEGW